MRLLYIRRERGLVLDEEANKDEEKRKVMVREEKEEVKRVSFSFRRYCRRGVFFSLSLQCNGT